MGGLLPRQLRTWLPAVALLLGSISGCGGGLHPVRGTVTLEDGSPLTQGMVIFEGTADGVAVMARGEVKIDGSYQLSSTKPNDGAPAGMYRVRINPMDRSEVPDEKKNLPYDIKYLKSESSGLEYEVKAGSNEFPIRLNRPKKKRP